MSFFEKAAIRVNEVENPIDVVLEAVGVNEERAKRFQVLEHFLDALPNDQRHLCAPTVMQLEQMSVTSRTWHHEGESSVERVDQRVVHVEDDVKTAGKAFLDDVTWGDGRLF